MGRRTLVVLSIASAAVALAWVFRDQIAALSRDEMMAIVYLLMALTLVGGGLFAGSRNLTGGRVLRDIVLWVLILFGALAVYVVKDDLGAMLRPSAPYRTEAGVELRRADDGHFYADTRVDDVPVRMMVDTGATAISLSRADAARIGINLEGLQYVAAVSTGAGQVRAAPTALARVSLGAIEVEGVDALVMGQEAHGSVLGLSFLDRLEGYEVRGDRLILYPRPQ